MPKKTDEMMGLADVYAEAVLGAAGDEQAEQVAREFAELIAYMDTDPVFEQFLISDTVDDDARRASLDKLFRGRMSDSLLNLLQVLNNRNRLDFIRQVYRAVELRMEARHHQQEVIVETAMPLTPELKDMVKSRISSYIDKEALLIERVVPELVGGVVIHIQDIQIDASVSSRVRTMRQRFSERAVHAIHDGRGVEGSDLGG